MFMLNGIRVTSVTCECVCVREGVLVQYLSRRDEVALWGACKGQLLLGDHHHLGASLVDVCRSHWPGSTTGLDPWSTAGHS